MPDEIFWIRHGLAAAVRGQGFVEPNPMVGAVVLDPAGQLVGEGYHAQFGGPHAEVIALAAAGQKARGGTLFVTLEPCCHHGKTPPCTDAIVAAGIRRVVAAMTDPFPKVAGSGVERLRTAGIAVEVGIGEDEAKSLNAPYLKRLTTGRPWVHLKWAMSLDGKLATRTGDSKWISSEASRRVVHEMRGRMDAILVGGGTVRADDPLLTARPAGPRVATRVVWTKSGHLPADCRLTRTAKEHPVLVVTAPAGEQNLSAWRDNGAEVLVPPDLTIASLLAELGRRGMTNVIVEGGAGMLGAFIDAGEADEVHVFVGPKVIGEGLPVARGRGVDRLSDAMGFGPVSVTSLGGDVYLHARSGQPDRPGV